jgi:hypothetical protein
MKITSKIKKALLLILVALTFQNTTTAQITSFSQVWGGIDYDNQATTVVPTSENGFLCISTTANFLLDGVGIQVTHFKEDGSTLWNKQILGAGMDMFSATAAIETSDGGFVIVGEQLDFNLSSLFAIKLNSDGNQIWERNMGNDNIVIPVSQAMSVVENGSGELVISGSALDTLGQRGGFLVKLATNGNTVWTRFVSMESDLAFYTATTDNSDNIYVAGSYAKFGEQIGTALMKWDDAGSLIWKKNFRPIIDTFHMQPIQIDISGSSLIVSGILDHSGKTKDPNNPTPLPLPDGFSIKTDLFGTVNSSKHFVGGMTSIVKDLKFKDNRLYVLHNGLSMELSVFDMSTSNPTSIFSNVYGNSGTQGASSIEFTDQGMVLLGSDRSHGKLNLKGELTTMNYLVTTIRNGANSCSNSQSTSLTIQTLFLDNKTPGHTTDTMNLDFTRSVSVQNVVGFDSTYCTGTLTSFPEIDPTGEVNIYPNPFRDYITISLEGINNLSDATLILLNTTGQIVKNIELKSNNESVKVSDLASGLYIYKISNNGLLLGQGKLVK